MGWAMGQWAGLDFSNGHGPGLELNGDGSGQAWALLPCAWAWLGPEKYILGLGCARLRFLYLALINSWAGLEPDFPARAGL